MPAHCARTIALAILTSLAACGGSREAVWDTTPESSSSSEAASTPDQRETLMSEADEAWNGRDDEAQVRVAIEKLKSAAEAQPGDGDTWVRLSRAYYFLSDCHLRFDESKQEEFMSVFEQGTQAAEHALVAQSDEFAQRMRAGTRIEEAVGVLGADSVGALYWRSSNLGKWAAADSFATLLSYKDEIRAVMSHCLEQDPEYYYAGPHRYFGAFYGRAPAFAGGDTDRSREHFEISIRHSPNYFATRVLMAQDYAVKAQDRAAFDEQINYVLNTDPESGGAEIAPENRCEVRKARLLQEQADDLFE